MAFLYAMVAVILEWVNSSGVFGQLYSGDYRQEDCCILDTIGYRPQPHLRIANVKRLYDLFGHYIPRKGTEATDAEDLNPAIETYSRHG